MHFVSSTSLTVLAMSHGLSLAFPLNPLEVRQDEWDGTRPSPGTTCNGNIQPKFSDCRAIMKDNSYFGGDERSVCVKSRDCRVFTQGNCRISLCSNEDTETCDSNTEWGRRAKAIVDYCEDDSSGGYDAPAASKPWTEVALRAASEFRMAAANGKSVPAPYQERLMTVEENDAEVQRIEAGASAQRLKKRESFTVTNKRINVERPGAQKDVTDRLPPSGKYTISESESTTIGVITSVSIGGELFKAMTAEIGIEVSSSYTVSSSEGVEVPVEECEGSESAVVVWFPLFNYYEGTFEGSDDIEYLWVPQDTKAAKGNYRVRCLG